MKYFALSIGIARGFLDALAFMLMWSWFVVPLGLKPITYWHAYGLNLFAGFLIGFATMTASQVKANEEVDDETVLGHAILKVVTVGSILLIAYFVQKGV